MSKAKLEKNYTLNNPGIDSLSADVNQWLGSVGVAHETAIRIQLTMEELFLRIADNYEGEIDGTLIMGKRLGTPYIKFCYQGESFNPMEQGEEEIGEWTDRALQRIGLAPSWHYQKGQNQLFLRATATSHRSELILIGVFLVAIILGVMGNSIPVEVKDVVGGYILEPISDAFLRLLQTFAGLMIFASVSSGITGLGSASEVHKVGKLMVTRYVGLSFVCGAVEIALARPFFSLSGEGAVGGASQWKALLDLILNIIPPNPIKPFLDGSMLQIVFMATLIGAVAVLVGDASSTFRKVLADFSAVVIGIVRLICKLLPLYIFCALVSQFWENGLEAVLKLWKPIVVAFLLGVIIFVAKLITTGIRLHVRPLKLLSEVMPSMIIAFTSASSVSAYGASKNLCEKKFGINSNFVDTEIPMGIILDVSTYVALYIMIAYFAGETYGVTVNLGWYFALWLLSVILSIATPPIAGGVMSCLAIMLTQLGIPLDALALAATLSVFLEFVCTGFRVGHMNLEIAVQADKLGMMDHEVFRKNFS